MEKKESIKYDIGKLRWDLLPIEPIEEAIRIYMFGAKKYGENRWQELPEAKERYYNALMRHQAERQKGNLIDPESGHLHSSHMLWNCIALVHFDLQEQKNGNG